ncbi:hypothetical protein DsansV1_C16g0141481 [Dioscorea sansibarensis]
MVPCCFNCALCSIWFHSIYFHSNPSKVQTKYQRKALIYHGSSAKTAVMQSSLYPLSYVRGVFLFLKVFLKIF